MPKRSRVEKATIARENNIQIAPAKIIFLKTTKFNVLHKIADYLEINELEEDIEDQIDGFGDKVKEIIQELFEEFKDRLEPDQEKGQFVKALIRIFSILLNTKANSETKIKKRIRTSAQLALELWPEPKQP